MAVTEKWRIFYNTNSDVGELDLEAKVTLLQNHTSAVNKVGNTKVNYFEILVSAKERYTKVETSGNTLIFDSEGKDGSVARLRLSSWYKADGLPRYEVCISDDGVNYHYRIIPKKTKKEKQD